MAAAVSELTVMHFEEQRAESARSLLFFLFFISGFAALLYQVVWQRALFAIYGINIESVTVVVSAFMLGLGLGSLLGGYISQMNAQPILVFGCAELGIAIFGFMSLRIFHAVAVHTAGVNTIAVGIFTFLLVLIPTVLMGMTLPVLVAHCVRSIPNLGRWTSSLYCVNTLGSAIACIGAGVFLLGRLGQSGCVTLAACINVVVGLTAIVYLRIVNRTHLLSQPQRFAPILTVQSIPFVVGILIAGISGLVALAYEILWYRVFAFATATKAQTFPFVLGMYLNGIAFGAVIAERICRSRLDAAAQRRLTGILIILGNMLAFGIAPAASYCVQVTHVPILAFLLLPFGAILLGTIFPLACQLSVLPDEEAGSRMSKLYFSNIIGSILGSLGIGYFVMDFMSTAQVSVLLASCGIVLGLVVLAWGDRTQWKAAAGLAVIAAIFVVGIRPSFSAMYRRLLSGYRNAGSFEYLIENRSGVVGVLSDRTVIGGGAYDGMFNTDPLRDSNGIFRAYALSAIHGNPEKVLMIGLSSGSWAQVIVNHPSVEHLTIVEINPGYLSLIPRYGEVSSVLSNPKVTIEIDDGRRWLQRNSEAQFDAIVMNTTWHWRSNITNLLSTEFLQLVRRHLRPGGVFYYNTTESPDVQLTATTVFPYAVRIWTFMAVSDSPIVVSKERWLATMRKYAINGTPVLSPATSVANEKLLNEYSGWVDQARGGSAQQVIEYSGTIAVRYKERRIVTDDNMACEWGD